MDITKTQTVPIYLSFNDNPLNYIIAIAKWEKLSFLPAYVNNISNLKISTFVIISIKSVKCAGDKQFTTSDNSPVT